MEMCNSEHEFTLGKGLFSKNVIFHCHKPLGHYGMHEYKFQWS